MPAIAVNDIELYYESEGDPAGPAVLLIAGLGVQLIDWSDHFVQPLIDAGHHVIRFDNRDVGLSTLFDGPFDPQAVLGTLLEGGDPGVDYTLADMATDTAALLDALAIDRAHLVGVSMGAMIAQTTAIMFPHKVLSLTSIMSTTGSAEVGQPTPDALAAILAAPAGTSRDEVIAHNIDTAKAWASPEHFDPEALHRLFSASWDRTGGRQEQSGGRHFCAILASPARDDALTTVHVPALVVHGTADTLISFDGGERTARCLPNAKLMLVEGMGHDLPPAFTPQITNAINELVRSAAPA